MLENLVADDDVEGAVVEWQAVRVPIDFPQDALRDESGVGVGVRVAQAETAATRVIAAFARGLDQLAGAAA